MNELYRDFIDRRADDIINTVGGIITPAPANAELYRDFLDRKFTDVQNGLINVLPIGSASGNPATFNTSLALPLVACNAEFMCTQASGTPTPTSPIPIVGVNDITLTVNGNSVVVDLDGTRYGGYVDVVNSVLTITHEILDLGSLTWVYRNNNVFSSLQISDAPNLSIPFEIICDSYLVNNSLTAANIINYNEVISSYPSYNRKVVMIRDTNYTDADDFKTAVEGSKLVYELATPVEISLSDIPTLSTIIGNNSFASDIGTVDVKYRCLPIDLI